MINQPLRGMGISSKAVGEAFGSSGTEGRGIPVLSLALCIASVRWQQLCSLGCWCSGHPPHLSSVCSLTVFRKKIRSCTDCESWTIKKAERQRNDAFELCWRRLLRVPWTARRSNQSILKENNPEYSLEGLMLKLKLWYFGYLFIRKDPDTREKRRQEENETTEDEMVGWHHWLNGHEFEQALGVGDGPGGLVCCSPWGRVGQDLVTE